MASEAGKGRYVCTLSKELQQIAKDELQEEPSRIASDIEAIRTWSKKQPHLQSRIDDMFILKFLRATKFSLERTKEKIDDYYTLRTAIPEWFASRDVSNAHLAKLLKSGFYLPLKGYNKAGRKVCLFRPGSVDPKEVPMDEMMKSLYIALDTILMDEVTSVTGIEFVVDMTGASFALLSNITISLLKKSVANIEALPVRFKGIHFWKMPSIFEKIITIFKSLMKDKLKERIHVHGSELKVLRDLIPLEMLPEEYGGVTGKMPDMSAAFAKEILELEEYFLEEAKYKVSESKRPGKPKSHEDLFGIDGSFRKLEID